MTKGWKRESARHSLARKGIESGAKKKVKQSTQSSVNSETFFVDFFSRLGESFVANTEKKGGEVGTGLFGAGKKIKTGASNFGGMAEESGENFISILTNMGESLIYPPKKGSQIYD